VKTQSWKGSNTGESKQPKRKKGKGFRRKRKSVPGPAMNKREAKVKGRGTRGGAGFTKQTIRDSKKGGNRTRESQATFGETR